MSIIRVDQFRTITGVTASVMSNETVSAAIKAASDMANRIAGRCFGLAIDLVSADGANAMITACGHGLPPTGSVYIQGTGIVALTGEVAYTAVDENRIRIAGVTVSSPVVHAGMIGVYFREKYKVLDSVATLAPGPVCSVSEVRIRSGIAGTDGPFPDESVLNEASWYMDTDVPNLSCELEVNANVAIYRRVPGLMNPVRQRVTKEIQVAFFAGYVFGVPYDLQAAIAGMASELGSGNALIGGYVQSESFEDYSYSAGDVASLRNIPTSAIATLLRYQVPI